MSMNRRDFHQHLLSLGTTALLTGKLPAEAPANRPQLPFGVASGDVTSNAGMVWSRTDRPSRMIVEYATNEAFRDARRVVGPAALEPTDFTARVDLRGLPAGQTIFYRVRFQDLGSPKVFSEPVVGRFRTAPIERSDILFAWGGDTAGQGWGIDPNFGGMKVYESIQQLAPQFFVHSGDNIYADGPLPETVKLADGRIWKNLVTEAKSKVAETLQEFRGNYQYNLLDQHLRAFQAAVPVLSQWDDHETRNNWFPGQMTEDERYTVKSCDLLAARAKRAFLEYMPIRLDSRDPERIHRQIGYGPLLDLFFLDERSFRGPNTSNRQAKQGPETAFLGQGQLGWLKRRLKNSQATWKVICSDMPIGLCVPDRVNGQPAWENAANGDGPALGRELELADLFRFLKQSGIRNVIWLTADVHYAAAHYYDPAKAVFTDFRPFWEFVAGPLHAGTFGPNQLDNTFGPQVKYLSIPKGMAANRSPAEDLQFFGTVHIDGKTEALTVTFYNRVGKRLHGIEVPAERG